MDRKTFAAIAASVLLTACVEGDLSCREVMADDRSRYGPPENSSSASSDRYQATTWYWWSQGVSRTYVVENSGCAVTRRTFSPT